jgi:hypothetical protein
VVRVLQTLPSGAHVELYEWPAPVAEPKADSVGALARVRAAAAIADTVTIQGLQVTARAAVTPDSLRVLLGKVRR